MVTGNFLPHNKVCMALARCTFTLVCWGLGFNYVSSKACNESCSSNVLSNFIDYVPFLGHCNMSPHFRCSQFPQIGPKKLSASYSLNEQNRFFNKHHHFIILMEAQLIESSWMSRSKIQCFWLRLFITIFQV